jgi:hypothetical protein
LPCASTPDVLIDNAVTALKALAGAAIDGRLAGARSDMASVCLRRTSPPASSERLPSAAGYIVLASVVPTVMSPPNAVAARFGGSRRSAGWSLVGLLG